MLHLLHTHGAKMDMLTNDGSDMYAMHWAAKDGRLGAMRFLLSTGVDMNVQDSNGCTPIVFAAQHNRTDAVIYLWKNGADMTITDKDGDSCHHWAAYKGFSELLGLLYHINPRGVGIQDNYGQMPLHLASMRGHQDAITFLVSECRADMAVRDRNGLTPLELAIKKKHLNCELTLRRLMGMGTIEIAKQIGWSRIRMDSRSLGHIFCASNEEEVGRWPWRVVFTSNFIASLVTMSLVFDEHLIDLGTLHVFNVIVQSVWWFCFLMCLFKSPSLVTDDISKYDAALDTIGQAMTEDDLPNLCHSCRVRRPLRSKHCKIQRCCINKFDHFCPFVGNAIGRDNYVYFCSLLMCHMIAGALWLTTVVYLYRRTRVSWALLGFAVYSVGWIIMLLGLLQFHLYLLTANLSTNEHMNAHKYAYLRNEIGNFHNPFSKDSTMANVLDGLFPAQVQYYSRDEVLAAATEKAQVEEKEHLLPV